MKRTAVRQALPVYCLEKDPVFFQTWTVSMKLQGTPFLERAVYQLNIFLSGSGNWCFLSHFVMFNAHILLPATHYGIGFISTALISASTKLKQLAHQVGRWTFQEKEIKVQYLTTVSPPPTVSAILVFISSWNNVIDMKFRHSVKKPF